MTTKLKRVQRQVSCEISEYGATSAQVAALKKLGLPLNTEILFMTIEPDYVNRVFRVHAVVNYMVPVIPISRGTHRHKKQRGHL